MTNLYNELEKLLAGNDQYMSEDGTLMKNRVVEAGLALQPDLIRLLLTHDGLKRNFFTELDAMLIFDKVKFQKFVMNKRFLPDSYTSFKNKIGLVGDEGDFLAESREVVLSFPYKDCVLEGGQTKEDAKRNEVFWNEILAPDDVHRLTEAKVFSNFQYYDSNGISEVDKINKTDNLIIKGNNLLTLYSLLETHRGKIDIIYIDPPYNTMSAANTFCYNNTFNHSSWMTFMMNRLKIAKELLSPDGVIFVAIDHYELFYLGIQLDEIYGRENRLGVVTVVNNPGGRQDEKFFPTANEFMLVYAKNIDYVEFNTLGITDEKVSQYKLFDENGRYKLRGLRRSGNNSKRAERPGLYYSIYFNPSNGRIDILPFDGAVEILPIDEQGVERCWRWSSSTFMDRLESYIEVKKIKNSYDIYVKERECDYQGEKPKTIWDKSVYSGQTGTNEIKNLLGEKTFSYPKSPYVIIDVLKIASKKKSVVLDFFGGSGTTAHAVLELNKLDGGRRKFIICEQMDYVETVTRERIWNVIKNNQKDSFVYCELAMANQRFVEAITACATKEGLLAIWQQMQESGFLSWKVEPKQIDENANELMELSIADMQKFLIECLDKNMLYIPYSEIDNQEFGVSDADKKVNKAWYNKQ